MRYSVDGCPNDRAALRSELQAIADAGGRVVSVTWQPALPIDLDGQRQAPAGFTIVSEFPQNRVADADDGRPSQASSQTGAPKNGAQPEGGAIQHAGPGDRH